MSACVRLCPPDPKTPRRSVRRRCPPHPCFCCVGYVRVRPCPAGIETQAFVEGPPVRRCPPFSRGQQCHVSAGFGAVMLELLLSRNRRCCSSSLFVQDPSPVFFGLCSLEPWHFSSPSPTKTRRKSASTAGWSTLPQKGAGTAKPSSAAIVRPLSRPCTGTLASCRKTFKQLSSEEATKFFADLALQRTELAKDKSCSWSTVRASLVTTLAEKRTTTFKQELEGKFLPLSVWEKQGFDTEKVKNCPKEESEVLGDLYCVPIKTISWSETVEKVRKKPSLDQERQATAKKQAKGKNKTAEDLGLAGFLPRPARKRKRRTSPS